MNKEKLICSDCKSVWEGGSWIRKNGKRDFRCKCGSKKKPLEQDVLDSFKYTQGIIDASKEFGARVPAEVYYSTDTSWCNNEAPEEYLNKTRQDNMYENILCVGDIHEPWSLDEYLDFCIDIYNKYNCDHVIFLGDILDNNFSSTYATDPDGISAGDELNFAIRRLSRWSKAFPKADVCIGNHEERVMKQCFNNGLSKQWIRDFKDVLKVNWDFKPSFIYNDCLFRHGVNMKAAPKSGSEMMNVVQGHFHTEAYIHWSIGNGKKVFGMQVPCGISQEKYVFAYAKDFPKPAIGCAVLLEGGRLPVLELMDL